MKLNNIKQFTLAVIGVLILGVVFFQVVPTSYFLNEGIKSKTEIALAFFIGLFAIVEGFSTTLQYYFSVNDNKKNDMRYALENVITPMYGLLALEEHPSNFKGKKEFIELYGDEATKFKEIISRYRYLLPDKEIGYMEEPNVGSIFLEVDLVQYFITLYDEKLKEYYDFVKTH